MYLHTLQADVITMAVVTKSTADSNATLVGTANLNQAYRIANLLARQKQIKDWTNGLYVSVKAAADAVTGTFEIWGYPILGGIAQFFGTYTFTTDEAVDDDGLFYVDLFVESVAGQHAVTIKNFSDGAAVLKFDTLGLAYFIFHVTVLSAGECTVELRPW